jgi:plasmid stability protein
MKNVTIALDESVLRRARVRAAENGTSVNAVLAEYIERYADASDASAAIGEFLELAAATDSGSGPGGRTWTREELHDRAGLR